MKLQKLTFIECPGIEGPVSQCYDSDYKAGFVDEILEATKDGTQISPLALSTCSSRIMRPIGEQLDVNIEGTWRQNRFKFAMVVEIATESRRATEFRYIVGYTDRVDGHHRGDEYIVDPDTRLYFDKVVRIGMRQHNYGRDVVWQPTIHSASQVLRRDSLSTKEGTRGGRGRSDRDGHFMLRPTDLFRRRDYDLTGNEMINTLRNHPSVRFENTVGGLTQPVFMNDIFNNSATNHLSRSIGAMVSASTDPVTRSGRRDDDAVLSGAVERLDEPTMDGDRYIQHLRNYADILRDGYITLRELLDSSPDYHEDDYIVKFSTNDQRDRYADSSRWGGDSPAQIAARILSNGLPTVMLNAGYALADGIVINTRASQFYKTIQCMFPGGYVPGVDVEGMLPYFEETLEKVILREATNNGLIDIEARINANIDTEITIDISVDGGPWEFFVYPAWGSGLVAPIQTLGSSALENLSHSITSLATDVVTARNDRLSSHTSTSGLQTSLDSNSIRDARNERDSRRESRSDSRDLPQY